MIEIYTPKQWYSTFKCEFLVIADDGFIYNREDYYKTLRNPIGKIDYKNKLIYGDDCCRAGRYPIGSVKEEGGITYIYDYKKSSIQTWDNLIFYVKDGAIYPADQFHKTFPQPAAYLKDRGGKETACEQKVSATAGSVAGSVGGTLIDSGGIDLLFSFWGIFGIVIALCILGAMFFLPYQTLKNKDTFSVYYIIALCIGIVSTIIAGKNWKSCCWSAIIGTTIGSFAVDAITSIFNHNITLGKFLLGGTIGLLGYGILAVVPGIMIGTIVWFVKRPSIKKKKEEEKKK
ncbi:MAG: hypothetical protein IKW30_08405 [Lachnospiraceae bacterium]|nr:hypothetical protein [Lachnospiraceae bacterium]